MTTANFCLASAQPMRHRWAILTGEYPPQPGGVSDYSQCVAGALAEAGDDVEVWGPPCTGPAISHGSVRVRRLPDCFGRRGLDVLDRALSSQLPRRRLLLQYVPHAFGCKAMNVRLCAWLFARRNQFDIWTMFHEVTYPWALRQPARHNLLAAANRGMALLLARASRRAFVSTLAWSPLLRPLLSLSVQVESLPIPSNISTIADADAVARIRSRIGSNVVGHFGSYGPNVAPMLKSVITTILTGSSQTKALLCGRGAAAFVAAQEPAFCGRMMAAENLSAQAAADHVAACDLMVQPYPDGATTRRSSLMAALALGVPIATTSGHLTESLWAETGAVALAPVADKGALAKMAIDLLQNSVERRILAERGKSLYDRSFALRHTIDALRGVPRGPR